ncbi:energy-coupling factor transport system ATP-binding protein [Paenibacillus castaneae]|uniref:ABC transporter ATP-binding protein n=1 Tax=Paenibacillus castaneae TaxID=474957 RepID=UPI000C9D0768|nr:ABC transporter ATP-binding protein [Paenibacillus castaneae]NIK77196.1 energy-coupling factor transport system ATP-binding protein [Paenibacillus castaneae]
MAIFEINDVSFQYPNDEQLVLQNIQLYVEQGEFIVLVGQSGCGKSTLLRQLKRELAPHGQRNGSIKYNGIPLEELDPKIATSDIGFVLQNPENQVVTDKVWHELSFGLESLGMDTPTIRRRVAEMASFFGMHTWFRQKTVELSGGQKQKLNLASIMVMQPKVLLLDEPTSQLDPIAAMEFIATLHRLNEELGITIILIEHRLEEVLPVADRVIVMEQGQIIYDGSPRLALASLPQNHTMIQALPTAMRVFHAFNQTGEAPLTIKEGQKWLAAQHIEKVKLIEEPLGTNRPILMEAKNISFRYERDSEDILRSFQLQVYEGEILTILGGNGTGKSTALKVLAGLEKPYRGDVHIKGKKLQKYSNAELYRNVIAVLPQDPRTLFVEKKVKDELSKMVHGKKEVDVQLKELIALLEIGHLLERHPYDLSGGEQQKVALAKVLLLEPQLLLLDEPTKGIDAFAKQSLANLLKSLQRKGLTVVIVTHDIEFSAMYSERCALFFDGNIVSCDNPRAFYSGNRFYTTAAHRMSRHVLDQAITCEDVVASCREM